MNLKTKRSFAVIFLLIFCSALMPVTASASDSTTVPVSKNVNGKVTTSEDENAEVFSGINDGENLELEFPIHPSAENFINDYIEKNKPLFEKIRLNYNNRLDQIDDIFEKKELPLELKYLAIVESKLKTNAVSKAGAAGMWQFMPSTARTLGLKVSGDVDERKNSWKSSVAAARYLKNLYKMFDDWLLAIAAYNSGPGHVLKAIKRSGSRDFWELQYYLPKETRVHVKKFIATHYYFEGDGSAVTLTRDEYETYLSSLEEEAIHEEENSPGLPETPVTHKNIIAVVRENNHLLFTEKK